MPMMLTYCWIQLAMEGRYLAMEPELRPASPVVAIKDCDAALFPKISILIQIACTIPATPCECKRSASTLRRLNNYMHASMGKDRLSHLALLNICCTTPADLGTVVDCYAWLHPPSTSTGKSSTITVSLILCDINIKGPF